MRVESHRKIPDDPSLRAAWNALVDQMDRPEVFYTWEWAKAVERAYSASLLPWLMLAFEEDALVGVASLALDSQGRATFLAGTTADYCDFIAQPAQRENFLEAVFRELCAAGCREVALANLPQDPLFAKALLRIAPRHGYHTFSRPAYECAQVSLGSREARDQLRVTLAKKKWFRRNMAGLGRDGPISLKHLTTLAEAEAALPEFARAHVARFLSTHRISNIAHGERRVFLHELARLLCETKSLCLSRLSAGDRVVAWNYGFRFHGSWFWYQPTFDGELEVFSPGTTLLANILIEACQDPDFHRFDMGLGAEGYKERFANASRSTEYFVLSRSRRRIAREAVRHRLVERIKRSPKLESAIRKTLSQLASARAHWRQGPGNFAGWAAEAATRPAGASTKLRFYRWSGKSAVLVCLGGPATFHCINYFHLADAVMMNEGDEKTVAYALRAADRLRSGKGEGFVLIDSVGRVLHLCWVRPFEESERKGLPPQIQVPNSEAALIFDSWTPQEIREGDFASQALGLLAEHLTKQGRQAWSYASATDAAAAVVMEKAGFEYRCSMTVRITPSRRSASISKAPARKEVAAP